MISENHNNQGTATGHHPYVKKGPTIYCYLLDIKGAVLKIRGVCR